jgi:uncharacterized membrane protein YkvA (DUF1232 family)
VSDLFRLYEVIKLFIIGGFLLAGMFLVLLVMPQSRLREIAMLLVKLGFVAFCGVYALSSLDLMPEMFFGSFGLLDDAVAVFAGILAALSAVKDYKAWSSGRVVTIKPANLLPWPDDMFDL